MAKTGVFNGGLKAAWSQRHGSPKPQPEGSEVPLWGVYTYQISSRKSDFTCLGTSGKLCKLRAIPGRLGASSSGTLDRSRCFSPPLVGVLGTVFRVEWVFQHIGVKDRKPKKPQIVAKTLTPRSHKMQAGNYYTMKDGGGFVWTSGFGTK